MPSRKDELLKTAVSIHVSEDGDFKAIHHIPENTTSKLIYGIAKGLRAPNRKVYIVTITRELVTYDD